MSGNSKQKENALINRICVVKRFLRCVFVLVHSSRKRRNMASSILVLERWVCTHRTLSPAHSGETKTPPRSSSHSKLTATFPHQLKPATRKQSLRLLFCGICFDTSWINNALISLCWQVAQTWKQLSEDVGNSKADRSTSRVYNNFLAEKKKKKTLLHIAHIEFNFPFVRTSFQRLKKMTARVYLELAFSLRRSCRVDLVYQKMSGKQGV